MKRCEMCYRKNCYNIRPNGNVGLGTPNPCCKLCVGKYSKLRQLKEKIPYWFRKLLFNLGI